MLLDNVETVITDSKESAEIREKIWNIVNKLDKSSFDLGELLYKVKQNHFYLGWGFNSFKQYAQTLNMKTTKAQYLAKIASVMNDCKIPRAAYEPLGIGKLREVIKLDPNGTYFNEKLGQHEPMSGYICGLVAKGKDMTLAEVHEYVNTLNGLVGEDALEFMNFKVKKSVKENIIGPALELAKMSVGTVGVDEEGMAVDITDSRALEIICTAFVSDPGNFPEKQ